MEPVPRICLQYDSIYRTLPDPVRWISGSHLLREVLPQGRHRLYHLRLGWQCRGVWYNRGAKYTIGSIKNLKRGDTITYTTIYGTRTYAVEMVKIISNTDWSYLQATADNRITLTTCEVPGLRSEQGSHRGIHHGRWRIHLYRRFDRTGQGQAVYLRIGGRTWL